MNHGTRVFGCLRLIRCARRPPHAHVSGSQTAGNIPSHDDDVEDATESLGGCFELIDFRPVIQIEQAIDLRRMHFQTAREF